MTHVDLQALRHCKAYAFCSDVYINKKDKGAGST
jgi:hypothetical protein